ncbi:DNA phosphorothioation-dependent restriction protein DptH [Solibacillus isronensis]|nr:DNA phosphorothioation-dependent restriction protein DptH [Solibacillus isronensis]
MSNQFYNYLAEELIRYWKDEENKLTKGNRYFLRLDEAAEVLSMADALKSVEPNLVEQFEYVHEFGEPYKTFALKFGEIRLVVAYTKEGVLTDYLALIRNLVSDQQPGWENTALISIVSEQLDTIPGGSLDVQSEGMPLHITSLSQNLHDKLLNSNLSKAEKLILSDYLERIVNDHKLIKLSIFEFEEILATLYKGNIESEDYKKLGMFNDPDLETFTGKGLKNRIAENRELYEIVREANEYSNTEEQLQKYFTVDGASMMKKDDWQEVPFTEVNKDHQKYLTENKSAMVSYLEIKAENGELVWDRASGDNSSKKRKRHIIVFNPDQAEQITLVAKFSLGGPIKSLSKEYVSQPKGVKNVEVDVKKSNIHMTIPTNNNGTVFAHVTYKHEKRAALGADLIICVLPIQKELIEGIGSQYLLEAKKQRISLSLTGNKISFGTSFPNQVNLKQNDQTFEVDELTSYEISVDGPLFDDDEDIVFNFNVENKIIPFLINSELTDSTPILGSRIWKLVRESMSDMVWVKELNRLMHNHREYYLQENYLDYFEWESKWIDQGYRSGVIKSGILEPIDIDLSENMREAYSRFMSVFKTATKIPSISYVSEEYEERGKEYIKTYINEISNFTEGKPAGKKGLSLYRLGMIEAEDTLYITPFHPLMVAYKLKIYELLGNEEIDNVILNRLSPEALLPFVERGSLYRPQHQGDAPEWLVLKSVNQVTAADSVQYLSNVIADKLKQFKEHFGYLFTENSKAPILINVMNLPDDQEVLNGILNFMIKEISSKGLSYIKPMEVTLYTNTLVKSAFERFAQLKTLEQVETYIGIKIKGTKDLDGESILRVIRENLYFYRSRPINEDGGLRYAHITFYKMHAQESSAIQSMHEMKSDLALQGLYSSVPAMRDAETYKSGFGIKGYNMDENDYLIKTAYYTNELVGNSRNDGNDSYIKGNTVLSRVNTEDESTLLEIFERSHWVTFIDPTVDLGFFNTFSNDLVIIHYSDQYTSSSKFDAITVTNKSGQYYKVIEEFLAKREIEGTKANIINTIQAFNTFNGEWLLRIIGTKGYSDREKLSIISAIKYTLALLDHSTIKWVPISLEEILRVAGVFNLSKVGGIFSAKNLGVKGPTSDDLLLIGLEELDGEIVLHFYPIEVKFGLNGPDVISKAKEQVLQTKKIILDALINDYPNTFKEKFYKNFFVQLFLSNINKLVQGDIWPEKEYKLSQQVVEKLLKLEFTITDHLTDYIGKGAVVSFKEGRSTRAVYLDEQIQMIDFSQEDGFNGIVKNMESTIDWIHEGDNDLIKARFLKNLYTIQVKEQIKERIASKEVSGDSVATNENPELNAEKEKVVEPVFKSKETSKEFKPSNQDVIGDLIEDTNININININTDTDINSNFEEGLKDGAEDNDTQVPVTPDIPIEEKELVPSKKPLEEVRVLLGKVENTTKEVYWEYGHKELANRHLLISGKSGQGKTYFMQCLLLEKSRQGVPSIIVDYTDGFLPDQLEDEFVMALGDKFKQRFVYTEQLPINPFSRTVRQIANMTMQESNIDIAERIKSVFSAVYSTLGIQQLNLIYEQVIIGLERYDKQMSLLHLKQLLEEEGSNTATKTLSQIRPLIDRNPFTNEQTMNWKEHLDSQGDVFIIQLTGFNRDVQLIITEFLLWDLWNFSIRSGNKNTPMPVILDEAQNLDHNDEAPSARVLTEGRKFGWSAWFATQFLKSQMDSDELARLQNATQKVYFAQSDEDVSYIAQTLANNEQGDRKYWETKLLNLKKGQCIVQGPQLDRNGNLTKPQTEIVNITSLNDRL